MEKVLDEKCLNCNASIKFNQKENKFICEYCHSSFTLDEINDYKKKLKKEVNLDREFDLMEDMEGYNCQNCGAQIISLDNISSTSCIYCKSSAIIKNRLTGIYKPDSIIPFKFTKEDAISKFKSICKGRPLLPKNFNDINNISDMEGLYVPFWLYDLENNASIDADCTKVNTWMDAKFIYTKTSYYKVSRTGELLFSNIPNDGASRFLDNIMNAIEPFEYKEFKEFNTSYLAGYLAEKYDVSKDDAYLNVLERVKEDAKKYLKNDITGYTSTVILNTNNDIKLNATKYVLLPVYVLNIKYKDKIYHFAMNGQTGKFVGEIPVDKKKLIITIFLTFFCFFSILIILFLMLGYRW